MRPVVAVALLVLSALVAAIPPAQAQQPGPTAKILWAHGAAPAEGETLWSNFDKEDPGSTDTANGPGYNCGVPVPVVGQAVCDEAGDPGVTDPQEGDIEHTFTLPMDPALAVPLQFTDATITANLFFGASTGTGEGEAIVRLLSGDTVVAESAAIPFSYDQGYAPASGPVAVKEMSVPAGAELVWEIDVTGTATGFFLGIHDDNGKSNLVLPLGAGSAAVESLNGTTVVIQRTFNESTDTTLQFTWTGPATARTIVYSANGTGNATFVVIDGANATLLNASSHSAQPKGGWTSEKTVTGAAGNWSISIALSEFNGTVRLTINDPSGLPGAGGNGTSRSGTGATGNGTEDGDKKDTPAPTLAVVVGAVAIALAVSRRRRL